MKLMITRFMMVLCLSVITGLSASTVFAGGYDKSGPIKGEVASKTTTALDMYNDLDLNGYSESHDITIGKGAEAVTYTVTVEKGDLWVVDDQGSDIKSLKELIPSLATTEVEMLANNMVKLTQMGGFLNRSSSYLDLNSGSLISATGAMTQLSFDDGNSIYSRCPPCVVIGIIAVIVAVDQCAQGAQDFVAQCGSTCGSNGVQTVSSGTCGSGGSCTCNPPPSQ